MEAILEHIVAAQRFLAAVAGTAAFGSASSTQARSVCLGLSRLGGASPLEAAELGEAIMKMQLAASDRDDVLEAVNRLTLVSADSVVRASRRKNQDWTAISDYLTAAQWTSIKEEGVEKLCVIVHDLGCVLPSEPTFQMLSSLGMLAMEGPERASDRRAAEKKAHYKNTKRTFKSLGAKQPSAWCGKLPSKPSAFKASFPQLAGGLDLAQVVPCPFSLSERDKANNYKMRGLDASVPMLALGTQVAPEQIAQFGQAMLQTVGNMMKAHEDRLMGAFGIGGSGNPALPAPAGLPALPAPAPALTGPAPAPGLATPARSIPGLAIPPPGGLPSTLPALPGGRPAAPPAPQAELSTSVAPADEADSADTATVAREVPPETPARLSVEEAAKNLSDAMSGRKEKKKKQDEKAAKKPGDAVAKAVASKRSKAMKKKKATGKSSSSSSSSSSSDSSSSSSSAVRFSKPSFSVERSRQQCLCRTGKRGANQSFKIPYGRSEKYKTEAKAVEAAKKWVEKNRRTA